MLDFQDQKRAVTAELQLLQLIIDSAISEADEAATIEHLWSVIPQLEHLHTHTAAIKARLFNDDDLRENPTLTPLQTAAYTKLALESVLPADNAALISNTLSRMQLMMEEFSPKDATRKAFSNANNVVSLAPRMSR